MRNMNDILRQAQVMQNKLAKLQQEMAERTYEAASGGGMVKAEVSGKQELRKLVIDPRKSDSFFPRTTGLLSAAFIRKAGGTLTKGLFPKAFWTVFRRAIGSKTLTWRGVTALLQLLTGSL